MKRRILWWLILIVGFAFFVRVYKATSVPSSLSWDEASIGYNAYSILKTGRDEHGRFLPIDTFVAYGDYKPPLAVYITVPFVALFGLTELAVRLPSVIAGTFAVLLTYFLVKELYKRYNNYQDLRKIPGIEAALIPGIGVSEADVRKSCNDNGYTALLSAVLLAISPWHIQLSRAGWEANIALTILMLGIWLVLRARRNPRLLIICWMPFVLAMYTFNSTRYVAPLLGLLFFFWVRASMISHKRYAVVGVLAALIILAPLIPHLISPEARLRFAEVNIFSDLSIIEKSNERMAVDGNTFLSRLVHNRRVGFALEYLKHFFDHLEPRFLFIRGDGNPKFSLQDVGQLYLIEAPFLVYGVYRLFTTAAPLAWTLILWVVLAILPAAMARETPHALRIENSLPVWQIIIAYGIISNFKFQISNWKKSFMTILIVGAYLFNFSYFWHNYFNHYAKEYSAEWQYGYKEAIAAMRKIEDLYDSVVISEAYGRAYMYTLFFTRTDPSLYLASKRSTFDAAGFYHVFGFGKYRFTEKGIGSFDRETLYVGLPSEMQGGAMVLATINRPDGKPAFVLFEKP